MVSILSDRAQNLKQEWIHILGDPEAPDNLGILLAIPVFLVWSRPGNIPEDVVINYTVTINSSNPELSTSLTVSDQTQVSIQFLEEALAAAGECVATVFLVVANVADTDDSVAAVLTDSLPIG